MIKVSVIIPVYNGEKYLRQCLDSVCQQTLSDIEILCVDDGSTDSSYQILEEYQVADDRVRLFKQQNQFAGAARNLGKANAKGEYLVFWDCDDYFELTALEMMYNRIKEKDADVCVCGGKRFYQNKQKVYPWPGYLNKKNLPETEVFSLATHEKNILSFTNAAVWNKIYRREFIEEKGIDFQAIRNGNDVYFSINALCQADRVTYVDEALIYYRCEQEESLVGTLYKSPITPIQAWIDTAENLKKVGAFPEQSFVNKCCDSMIYLLRNISKRDAFYEAVEFLQNYGAEKLCIKERDDEFYYSERIKNIVTHLLSDSPEDFKDYLSYLTYIQLTEESAKIKLKNETIEKHKKTISDLKKKNTELEKKNKELHNQIEQMTVSKAIKRAIKKSAVYKMIKQ